MLQMYRQADHQAKMTLIGASLIKFAGGLALIWGSCNIYFFSYLKHQGDAIDNTTNSKLLLCALVPLLLTVPIANPFSRLIGYQNAIRLCAFTFLLSPMVINLRLNIFTFAVFWMIIPIACVCVSGIPLINCLWTQFPNNLSKVSGFAILMFSLGMILWNLIFMQFVNPDNAPANIDADGLPIFPEDVSNNVFKASNMMFGTAGIMNIIGSFMVQKRVNHSLEEVICYEDKRTPEVAEGDVIVDLERAVSTISSAPTEKIITLKQGLTDKRFALVFFISGLIPIYLVYLMQNIKLIYMPIINDDHFLSYCSALVTVSAVIGAPFWGFLGDIKGFKTTLLLIAIVDSCVKLFGIYSYSKWSLALLFLLLGANDKGLLTIIGPGLIGMFGIEMATQLIPYKGLALILSYIVAPVIQIIFANISNSSLLFIFLMCSLIGVFLSAYLKFRVHYKEIDPTKQVIELKPHPKP